MTDKSVRQQIISDDEVRQLIRKLLAQPEAVTKQQEAVAAAEWELKYYTGVKDAEAAMDAFKREIMWEVRQEVDEKGKMLFSNEAARDAEVERRSRDKEHIAEFERLDEAYRSAFKQRGQLEFAVARMNNSVRFLIDQSYSYKAVAEIVAGLCVESNSRHGMDRVAMFQGSIERGTNGK